MTTTANMFNEKSGVHKHGGHGMKSALHMALMLGMVLAGVAMAAPAGAATIGDAAVQTAHVVKDMIASLFSNFDVVADMAVNAAEGNFAPNTWEAGSMHGGAASHAGQAASGAMTSCDKWLSALSPAELSELQSDLHNVYGGMSLCEYHDINIMHHGVK